jgi:TolB protein
MDVSGANGKRVASFVEDQLPTWTADSQNILFLSRRTGDRKSQLMTVDANTENSDGSVVGEGEYPAIGANGSLVFKGWGNTAFGLRLASAAMQDIKTVTNVEGDTAPVLSPDGSKVAFMSQRDEGNWNVYVVNVDGSNLQRLTDDPAEDGLPVWSPDGNAIAFASNRGGIWAVWVMTPDGKGVSQLFTMPGTPDGFVGNDTYASRGWAEERLSWTSAKLVE